MNYIINFLLNYSRFIFYKCRNIKFIRKSKQVSFKGFYLKFNNALADSDTYASNNLVMEVEKTLKSYDFNKGLKYFKDGVIVDVRNFDFTFLGLLYYVNSVYLNRNNLVIVDYGGGLANLYFQNVSIFHANNISYYVVEQEYIVFFAKKYKLNNDRLIFVNNLSDIVESQIDIVVFGSVLNYLQNPYSVLLQVVTQKPSFIYIDRTYFALFASEDFLRVQQNKDSNVKYPSWFFNLNNFINLMSKYGYYIIYDGRSNCDISNFSVSKSLIFQKNGSK